MNTLPMMVRQSFTAPSGSCTGGAHRRCLLDADQCPCHCHTTALRVVHPVREVFPCPACTLNLESRAERVLHMYREHPPLTYHHSDDGHVVGTPIADGWFTCPQCGRGFDSKLGCTQHKRLSHPEPETNPAALLNRSEWAGALRRAGHRMATCTLARCPICFGDAS